MTLGSVFLSLLLLPLRLPGLELAGFGPNWLLIWVVAWSVKRTALQGVLVGVALGLAQDGITAGHPTHVYSLALVGFLTARLQKQRYVQEDFISIALIVFGMAVIGETITAIQFCLPGAQESGLSSLIAEAEDQAALSPSFASRQVAAGAQWSLGEIWMYHQRVALSSAILSSLWAPVVYYPLNHWWERLNLLDQT